METSVATMVVYLFRVSIELVNWSCPNLVDTHCGHGCFHGFIPAWSKTDNFKAEFKGKFEAPIITVRKFIDTNGNGVWDFGELEVGVDIFIDGGGWPISVTDPKDITTNGYTKYMYYVGMKGTHLVTEEVLAGWGQTAAILDGVPVTVDPTVPVYIAYTSGETHEVIFGNFECFTVDGYKYNDLNGDGDLDFGEVGIEGWTIELWRNGELFATTTTDATGYYSFEVCIGGEFEVREVVPSGWTATSPTSFTFTALSGQSHTYSFFNFEWFEVCGYKYNDMTANGVWDEGDDGLPGWTIELYLDSTLYATTTTDQTGHYCFVVMEPGSYTVKEVLQEGWEATYPVSGEHTFTAISGVDQSFDFLNFKEGMICGHKWYDLDMDGVKDEGEVYIEDFKIELYKNGVLYATTYSDSNGYYCFEHLGYGTYTVKEIMPTSPGPYYAWMQTYPSSGTYMVVLTSGLEKDDADFGNVVKYTGGLTWGYWKTHTGYDSPPRDSAYDLLPGNPMPVDLATPDNDYEIDSDAEAKWLFDGAGSGDPPNCSGDCRSLFRAQLMALHMNLLKFADMGSQTYQYEGDPYSGMTVDDIYTEAIDMLTDGEYHDFTSFQQTLDRINNNGEGMCVLILTSPPPIVY